MKTIKFAGILLTILSLSFKLMAQQAEQLVVPLNDPGKPYTLVVDLVFGSVKVNSYDGKDIIIEVQSGGGRREENDRKTGMKRISGSGRMDIMAQEKNNRVNVSSGMPQKQANLMIRIPVGIANLKVSTVNNGDIWVSNINGDMEIVNVNGNIKLDEVSGAVVANTINGNVAVTFKNIDPKAAMAFTTLNGNINVTFPPALKANVKLKSDRGDIFSDFDIVSEKSQTKINKSKKDGVYQLTIDETVYGKIGGGGPEILMKNMNGNIYLHKAK
ncbi:DUF4097 family beta strand repeat-containing protein [Mucilaginibacter paludis]|uniref:DUF4097 domain-containing protein n=1 Tax=Mucilaginibacter paludis DSM 18603 TaxID=714943 RepID=H1Y5K6_9SPHI|nr:DUF4097 family beta strand repeat-containing protein [Mucilaginibacter paludis]EHQ29358.1 hypothetical protein Mucpa_5283 [Mucilaginibacter paludis DSM 18603]